MHNDSCMVKEEEGTNARDKSNNKQLRVEPEMCTMICSHYTVPNHLEEEDWCWDLVVEGVPLGKSLPSFLHGVPM